MPDTATTVLTLHPNQLAQHPSNLRDQQWEPELGSAQADHPAEGPDTLLGGLLLGGSPDPAAHPAAGAAAVAVGGEGLAALLTRCQQGPVIASVRPGC